jgi:uncharacterized protein YhbP (UPF0306 family)
MNVNVGDLIRRYLNDRYTMQVATVFNGQPWNCTVYYVIDDQLNLYWASLPSRRHSQEINNDNKVAAAIVVQNDLVEKVVGIQIQGSAQELTNESEIKSAAVLYSKKFNRKDDWVDDIGAGNTEHRVYKLTPEFFVLFDEENFKDQPRQEWRPDD